MLSLNQVLADYLEGAEGREQEPMRFIDRKGPFAQSASDSEEFDLDDQDLNTFDEDDDEEDDVTDVLVLQSSRKVLKTAYRVLNSGSSRGWVLTVKKESEEDVSCR